MSSPFQKQILLLENMRDQIQMEMRDLENKDKGIWEAIQALQDQEFQRKRQIEVRRAIKKTQNKK